ncbi:hypothetical protein L6278_00480, partial [Candidatus Parcubacteria bacterium]|nr:hypothetical protein [Candidatus Parcubacteria bacterium]
MDLKRVNEKKLLILYSDIINELKGRNILRSSNNPVGDYAEFMVAEKFNLELQPNSNKSFDAIDGKTGLKYQVKGRRITRSNASKQLGVIRNLETADFDFLGE